MTTLALAGDWLFLVIGAGAIGLFGVACLAGAIVNRHKDAEGEDEPCL
jgi:hypothetical protein